MKRQRREADIYIARQCSAHKLSVAGGDTVAKVLAAVRREAADRLGDDAPFSTAPSFSDSMLAQPCPPESNTFWVLPEPPPVTDVADRLTALEDSFRVVEKQLTSVTGQLTSVAEQLTDTKEQLTDTKEQLGQSIRDLDFRTSYLAVDHLYILATDICKLALQHVPSQSSKEDKWSCVLSQDTPLSRAVRELMADAPLHGMDIPHALNIVIRISRNGEQSEDDEVDIHANRRWPYVDLCTEAGHSGGWEAAEKRSQGLKDAGALTGSIQENNQLAAWIVSHFPGFRALNGMSPP